MVKYQCRRYLYKVFGTCTRSRTTMWPSNRIGTRQSVVGTRSMYCSCTVDVERVAEQNRKGHRRCTGRRATIIIFKYHIMSPGIRSCAASLAQAEPARPRNAFAHRAQHEPSTYRYPAVTTLVFAFSFTRHSRTDSQLKCGRPESAWHKKQI